MSAGNLSLMLASKIDIICTIQKMVYFLCRLPSTDTKDPSLMSTIIMQPIQKKHIYGVGCPSIADTINLYLGVSQRIFGVM
jgi:hypothetical protein